MKRKELKEYIKNEIIEILSEAPIDEASAEETEETTKAIEDQTKAIEKLNKAKEDAGLTEVEDEDDRVDDHEMDKKAAKAAKKSKDSVSTISKKLADNTAEMKTVVKKWKEAEEPEKSKLLSRLKELTKIKQELEKLL